MNEKRASQEKKKKMLLFIKIFSKLSIAKACRDCKVNRSSLLNGTTSIKNIERVYHYIQDCYDIINIEFGDDILICQKK